jgi:hypothetical protein
MIQEITKRSLSDDRFLSFSRVNRSTFKDLVDIIGDDPVFKNDSQNPQSRPSIQIGVALHHLGLQGNSAVRSAEQLGLRISNYCHTRARIRSSMRLDSVGALAISQGHPDHSKALCWMMACFVLHNFIQIREEDRLEAVKARAEECSNSEEDNLNDELLSDVQELHAGKRWRDDLRIQLYRNRELI